MRFGSQRKTKPFLVDPANPDTETSLNHRLSTGFMATWNPWFLAILFAIFLFASGIAIDWFLMVRHESPFSTVEVSDALAAAVGGALFLKIVLDSRQRRRALVQRLNTIQEMNHHIRNALEVIALSAHTSRDQENMDAIRQSVKRINWALNEILPKL